MNERETARRIAELEKQVAELRAVVAHFPVRFTGGGGGAALPAGGRKFDVLMKLDDAGTVGWERPRFHE